MSGSNRRLAFVRPARSTSKWPLRVVLAACVLLFTSVGIAGPTFARSGSSFDGDWSVVIETRGGACTPTLRYPLAISGGVVTNAGDSPVAISGRVTPAGMVRVTVQSGGSWANGSGRLGTTGGTGVWRGQGMSGECAGTWQAERRSYSAQVMNPGAPVYNYAPQAARRYYQGYQSR